MRKIISHDLSTVRVTGSREEASFDSTFKRQVIERYTTARIQVHGTTKRVVRDRTELDQPGLVPYIYLSGECFTQDEAWNQAATAQG